MRTTCLGYGDIMNELVLLKNTLNKIEVSGKDNLSMLLACIQLVDTMIDNGEACGNDHKTE